MLPLVVSSAALPFDIRPILGNVTYVAPVEGSMSRAELLKAVRHAAGLITLLSVAVDEELLEHAPNLRVVANFAVGHDNVDLAAATRRNVVVANTPDVLTEATADFTFALLLAAARHIIEGDRLVRSGSWTGWAPGLMLGGDVAGQTLGIVGMGRIGQAVARRARGFGMDIVYTGPRPHPLAQVLAAELGARAVDKHELLATSDFVSLHCPLTPETRRIIDAAALATIMKKSAILINTARGACVDEAALAQALAEGQIAGAALDVFAEEPSVHPGLLTSSRVILAPHLGSATTTARRRMAEICAQAVRAALDGRRPPTLINPEVYS